MMLTTFMGTIIQEEVRTRSRSILHQQSEGQQLMHNKEPTITNLADILVINVEINSSSRLRKAFISSQANRIALCQFNLKMTTIYLPN